MMHQDGDAVFIAVKVIPNASRSQIVGLFGDRLKVKVSASPEDGKANEAVCNLFVQLLQMKSRDICVYSGAANPNKVIKLCGMTTKAVNAALEL